MVLHRDAAAVVIGDERGDVVGLQPGDAELRGDLRCAQRGRLHVAQRRHVAFERGVVTSCCDRGVELGDDVARQVVGRQLPLPFRSVEGDLSELVERRRWIRVQLSGDVVGVDAMPARERVGDGLLDGGRPGGPVFTAWVEDRTLQDCGGGRLAGVVVEVLERSDGPPGRVGPETFELRIAATNLGPFPSCLVNVDVVVVSVAAALDRFNGDEVVGVERLFVDVAVVGVQVRQFDAALICGCVEVFEHSVPHRHQKPQLVAVLGCAGMFEPVARESGRRG